MKRVKSKLISSIAASVLACCIFVPVSAAGATISMSKATYAVGEKPVATYTGTSQNDWIGIYHKGEEPGTINSIWWLYTKSISQPDGTTDFTKLDAASSVTSLPAGDYEAILCQNDGYTVLARASFTVKAASASAPKAIQYNRADKKSGYADGTVTITPPDNTTGISDYWLYWADSNGKLADYTPMIVSANGSSPVTFTMHANTFIPSKATKLIAYSASGTTLSDAVAEVALAQGVSMTEQTPLYSFEVFSDTHITSSTTDEHANHLDAALKDIKANDPDSVGIFAVGDITDGGAQSQYNAFKSILSANAQGLPSVYCAIGNHDLRGGNGWQAQADLFNANTGMSAPYFSKVIDSKTFIFLGSQTSGDNGDKANLYDDQLDWLKTQLASAAKGGRPIFVFLHQPLINTTSGTINGQGWNGVNQDSELRTILDQYPQVVMFTGHTHWELDANQGMYSGGGIGATFFNDGGVGALWTDAQQEKTGSQGLYVEVYADKILVRGRDFLNGKWVSNAQYMVDLTENFKALTDAIPTAKDGLIAQKDKISQLLSDINAMPEASKTSLKAITDKLNDLNSQIDALQSQLETVSGLITSLPQPDKVSLSDKTKILEAQSAFDNLTNEQKTLLGSKATVLSSVKSALSALEGGQTTTTKTSTKASSAPTSGSQNDSPKTGSMSLLPILLTLLISAGSLVISILFKRQESIN